MRRKAETVKVVAWLVVVLAAIIILISVSGCTPVGVAVWNGYDYALHKTDDATNYHTIKKVEDSCRAMISSYESDRLVYEQYRNSDNEEKQSWAEQAKMRANKTAATYNNYVLENNFVWSGNVPDDIRRELAYLE